MTLAGLYRQVGDLPLEFLKTHQILAFLNSSGTSSSTWRSKYGTLRLFFEFWTAHGTMPTLLMPQNAPPTRHPFVPTVYTRREVVDLLRAVHEARKTNISTIDDETFRTILFVLYGTGAMTGEVLGLRRQDIDLSKSTIVLGGNRIIQRREIPVGADLRDLLRSYLVSRCRLHEPGAYIFVSNHGGPIKPRNAEYRFNLLRQRVGLSREGGGRTQPSMRDLRSTFAVHRIASWIRSRANLNRMLPALSAYLGQVQLMSTERYLSLTPERFRRELNKISPQRSRKHWRDDPALMKFLASL